MCLDYHPLSSNDRGSADGLGFTRRSLLGAGLTMVSAAATVPGFISRAGVAMADTTMRVSSRAGVPEDRVLVVVQLSGGNDGLNTIVPYAQSTYHRARGELAVSDREVLGIPGGFPGADTGVGLNPMLRQVGELMAAGKAAVVQGVGYPNPNRSHFVSMDIWHTASPEKQGNTGRGWIGRAFDAAGADAGGMACVSLGNEAPLATLGEHTRAVSFTDAETFRWSGADLHPALAEAYDAAIDTPLTQDRRSSLDDDPLAFVQRTALDARAASEKVRQAVRGRAEVSFPGSYLGEQLEMVSKMIRAGLPTRVYYVNHGGFDTHAGQRYAHPNLLRQFSEAVAAFQEALEQSGDASRVVTMAFSEFGRRVKANGSGGTDHGVAGPVFLMGEPVKPGLWGEHPSLTDLDDGDLKHAIDFRSVYADVLGNWLELDDAAALGRRFRPTGLIRTPA
ncbi:MAG: DUF1501 domain-containing protein [Planctomycetota bacterium]